MNTNQPVQHSGSSASLGGLMANIAKYGVVFDQDGINSGDNTSSNEPAKPDSKPPVKTETKPDESVAAAQAEIERLRKEVNEASKKLKSYGDATPEEIAELRKVKNEAEAAKKAAEEAQKKAEEDRLRKEGDFETLRARMAEEHEKNTKALQERIAELTNNLDSMHRSVVSMNKTSAFSASQYVTNETVLTPSKALKIYGDYVEIENGQVVWFDAPAGSDKRTMLVGADGRPLPFDEGFKRVVEADPERDLILKSKIKQGPGVTDSKTKHNDQPQVRGVSRIAQGLTGFIKAG